METEARLPTTLIGHVLHARYEVADYLGRGDITHVFRAWDQQLHHIVAVKVLDQRLAQDPAIVAAFLDAGRRAAALPSDATIARVNEVGVDQGVPYLVTEFVSGTPLSRIIADEGPLDVDRAFRIARSVARAMVVAHQFGLAHQNIEPENIMVARQDEVKLTDFGLVAAVEQADLGRTHVLNRASPYISPAQNLGRGGGQESDVYALGVVLYEMLAGHPPFQAANPVDLATQQTFARPPNIREINSTVTPSAAFVVQKALTWNQGPRFPNAAALEAALHAYLAHDPAQSTLTAAGPEVTDPVGPVVAPSSHQQARPVTPPLSGGGRFKRSDRRQGWRPWLTLIFLATIAIAAAGGWEAYRAVAHLLNPPSGTTPARKTTVRRVNHGPPARARSSRPGTAPAHRQAAASACPSTGTAPIRLANMWAEEIHPVPGHSVTFDYTIDNRGSQCRSVDLGLTAYPSAPGAAPLTDPTHDSVAHAQPGVHVYKRQFAFPAGSAGQTLSVLLTTTDPTTGSVLGEIRVNNLIAVGR